MTQKIYTISGNDATEYDSTPKEPPPNVHIAGTQLQDEYENPIAVVGTGATIVPVQDQYNGNSVTVLQLNAKNTWPLRISPKTAGAFYANSSDFTFEFWLRMPVAIGSSYALFFEAGNLKMQFGNSSASFQHKLQAWFTPDYIDRVTALSKDGINKTAFGTAWHHLAYVRHNAKEKLYYDGVSTTADGVSFGVNYLPGAINIGVYGAATQMLLHDFRYYKDIAKYTENFTPKW